MFQAVTPQKTVSPELCSVCGSADFPGKAATQESFDFGVVKVGYSLRQRSAAERYADSKPELAYDIEPLLVSNCVCGVQRITLTR